MWAVEHATEMMWYANVWAHECFSRIFWYYGSYTSKTQQREGINTFNTLYSLQCINKSMCFILFLSICSLSLSPAHFLSISHSVISKCFVANGSGNSTLWLCSKYKLSWYKYSIPTAAQTPQPNGTNVIITTTTANAKVF